MLKNAGIIMFFAPWGRAGAVLFSCIVLLLSIYHDTLFSLITIWNSSETFAHCYLIFPISGYLIWRHKEVLARTDPVVDYRPLLILAMLGLGWLLGNLAEVSILQQYALIAMIPVLVWVLMGWRVVKHIAFPLGFLLFSVPFGEFLIPSLIDFTADFTVALVKLTGIPIYREGTFFSLPTGDWSVVEACSGLRYLIASATLGTLFAYINYHSLSRRALFILAACIVPVIANGFRAFMIVMIGHFSGMTLAMGVDHFIYGWVFFGLVMALLFWIGSFWAEEEVEASYPHVLSVTAENRQGSLLLAAILSLAIAAAWPMRAHYINELQLDRTSMASLSVPQPSPPWTIAEPMTTWEPIYLGATSERRVFYTDGQHRVAVFLKYYHTQEQGKELVNIQNMLLPRTHPTWKMPGEYLTSVNLGGNEVKVLQGSLLSQQQKLLTWRWYWIGGRHTANDYFAKLLEARDRFLGHAGEEAAIILAVDSQGDPTASKSALQSFVDAMLPSIEQSLNQVAEESRQ